MPPLTSRSLLLRSSLSLLRSLFSRLAALFLLRSTLARASRCTARASSAAMLVSGPDRCGAALVGPTSASRRRLVGGAGALDAVDRPARYVCGLLEREGGRGGGRGTGARTVDEGGGVGSGWTSSTESGDLDGEGDEGLGPAAAGAGDVEEASGRGEERGGVAGRESVVVVEEDEGAGERRPWIGRAGRGTKGERGGGTLTRASAEEEAGSGAAGVHSSQPSQSTISVAKSSVSPTTAGKRAGE